MNNNLLSEQEKSDYPINTVLKNFQIWQELPVNAMLNDYSGNILAVNSLCQSNFGTENIIGLTDALLLKKFNVSLNDDDNVFHEYIDSACDSLMHIHQLVIQNKAFIKTLIIMPLNNEIRSLIFNYIPIFHENGDVVAVQKIISEFGFFGLGDYLNLLHDKKPQSLKIVPKNYKMPIKLSRRQHEMLFLLTNGINQSNIARILNVSRTAVAKTISEVICPKFAIHDGNLDKLIAKATTMNFKKYIPQSLCKICAIVFAYKALNSKLEINLLRVDN